MEEDADKAAKAWLDEHGKNFDPERHDDGAFYEASGDAGIEFTCY
jgi:hypothetical protein